jgi:hypothetical protein
MDILEFLSELDSNRFGFKICKVNEFNYAIEDILLFLKHHNVKLIISKVSLDNIDLINQLESNGFLIKDVQITYKFDINKLSNFIHYKNNNTNDNIIIRDFCNHDIESLKYIAKNSFLNYGHYAKDIKLDKNKSNEIYIDWIYRSMSDKSLSDKIIVAEYNKKTVGFLSLKINNNNETYVAGGIGAVDPNYRNKNIFKLITIDSLIWADMINAKWVEHNVIVNNYPVNKSFLQVGFYPYKSFATFHCWI